MQVSIDGATAATNDAVRGEGSFPRPVTAMDNLAAAGFGPFKISVVVTRQNMEELDALAAIADSYGAHGGPASSVFNTCFDRSTGSLESGNSTVESTSAPSPFPDAQNNFAFTRGSPGLP